MQLTEDQIKQLAPTEGAFKSGKKLSPSASWTEFGLSDRAIWGMIKGSGKNPYKVQIDQIQLAYKCSCPSRQFPCKHAVGLLLLHSNENSKFQTKVEPEWVQDWLDKRNAKANKPVKEEKELTDEELEKRNKSKQKRVDNRLKAVEAGLDELELWLKDLVRIGILNLPNRSDEEFKKVAARMVDAKASGLAGWVKSFLRIDYTNPKIWQDQAIETIAKIYLLIKSYKNKAELSPELLITIKNLIGWNQSPKELLEDKNAKCVQDEWLVIGYEKEKIDDLTVHRSWLYGSNTSENALILNFESGYAPLTEAIPVAGHIIDAELAFFPGAVSERAVIKSQQLIEKINAPIAFHNNWQLVDERKLDILKRNPWANNLPFLIDGVRLLPSEEKWLACDREKFFKVISPKFEMERLLNFLVISDNQAVPIAVIEKNDGVLPIGVFINQSYQPI